MNKNYIIGGVIIVAIIAVGWWLTTQQHKSPASNKNQTAVTSNKNSSGGTDFTIVMKDTSFSPNTIAVDLSQTVTIRLKNEGKAKHSFTFDKLDFTSGPIDPGQTKDVVFTVPGVLGDYAFFSSEPGDKDKGLTGTMQVKQL